MCIEHRKLLGNGFSKAGCAFVDDVHKLFFCTPPKSGCTHFKRLVTRANAIRVNGSAAGVPVGIRIHTYHKIMNSKLSIKVYPYLDYSQRLALSRQLLSMFVVRHPFSRLESFWRDKLHQERRSDLREYSIQIFRKTRPNMFENAIDIDPEEARQYFQKHEDLVPSLWYSGEGPVSIEFEEKLIEHYLAIRAGIPRFQEFLDWLVSTTFWDRHWMPASDYCDVCTIPWRYIMRLETMDTDEDFLETVLGQDMPDVQVIEHRTRLPEDKLRPSMALPLWRNISKATEDYLLQKYEADFRILGYAWDSELKQTGCAIQTDSGICC